MLVMLNSLENVMFDNIVTVREAASIAGVGIKSIYYHINKSRKLPLILKDNQYFVDKKALDRLYYKVPAGRKQHVTRVEPYPVVDIVKINESIAFLRANGYTVLTEA